MSKLAHSNDEFMRILEELDYMGETWMPEQAQTPCRDKTTSTPDLFDGYKNSGDAT